MLPLAYKVKNKGYDSKCRFRCESCSREGEDIYRHCRRQKRGQCDTDNGVAPCCSGLTVRKEGGRMICRRRRGHGGGGGSGRPRDRRRRGKGQWSGR
mmetsp:Transcript_3660/g.10163  ORF Transcript_3660/g.10163 Transcript_3660/m.10163 type:complete len:97 (-) Transcript_3660:78-368(-)